MKNSNHDNSGTRACGDNRGISTKSFPEDNFLLRELSNCQAAILEVEHLRRLAEQARHEWLTALDTLSDLIFLHDRQFRVIRANRALARYCGLAFSEIVGKQYWRLFPGWNSPFPGSVRALEAGREIGEELQLERGRYYRSHSFPVFDQEGKYEHSVHVLQEITQQRHIQEELRASERRLADIINNNADGIVVLNREGIIQFVNTAACTMLGYGEVSLIGQSFGLPANSGESTQVEVVRADGSMALLEVRMLETIWEGELAYVVDLHDITERRLAEQEQVKAAEQLQTTLVQTIKAIAATIETRDSYTAGHQNRVARLAADIATEMGLPDDQVKGIYMAGIIHDIGKLYVPAEILNRPSVLTGIQFDLIKTHPQIGYDIVKGISFPWPVATVILEHHERLDGSGYPRGLVDNDIVLEARILAVADVIDAMVSHRPYRAAAGTEAALQEISQYRSTLYDPEAVGACLRLFQQKHYTFRQEY